MVADVATTVADTVAYGVSAPARAVSRYDEEYQCVFHFVCSVHHYSVFTCYSVCTLYVVTITTTLSATTHTHHTPSPTTHPHHKPPTTHHLPSTT